MWELVKMELRKVLPVYLPLVLALLAMVLFRPGVFGLSDLFIGAAGALLGAAVGYRLFTDAAGTRAFLFSRPYTRRRLFLVRWGVGMALLGLALAATAGLIAGGIREFIQVRSQSPWYPMVRWYELNALWMLGGSLLLGYGMAVLLVTLNDLETAERQRGRLHRALSVWFLLSFFAVVALATPFAADRPLGMTYVALVVLSTTLASLHGYRRLAVES